MKTLTCDGASVDAVAQNCLFYRGRDCLVSNSLSLGLVMHSFQPLAYLWQWRLRRGFAYLFYKKYRIHYAECGLCMILIIIILDISDTEFGICFEHLSLNEWTNLGVGFEKSSKFHLWSIAGHLSSSLNDTHNSVVVEYTCSLNNKALANL